MDPVSLSVIVAALVAKALEHAEDKAVDEASGILRRLVASVRARLAGSSERDRAALEGIEAAPDSPKQLASLTEALDRNLQDSVFRSELQQLVDEAETAGVPVGEVVQTAIGRGNVQIGGVSHSIISVNKEG